MDLVDVFFGLADFLVRARSEQEPGRRIITNQPVDRLAAGGDQGPGGDEDG